MERWGCFLELGLKQDEVKIVPYTREWKDEFLRVKKEIQASTHISEDCIEHIGSTAIENMPSKPIIDILVGLESLNHVDPSIIRGLKSIGFLQLRVKRPGEIVFAKFTDDTFEERTHYIHLVEHGKDLWENLIFFRDYLNANERARKDYMDLKLGFVQKSSTGIREYTDYKEGYVKSIFNKRQSA